MERVITWSKSALHRPQAALQREQSQQRQDLSSQRVAAKELRSHHNEIERWFRELQHYGFIVMTMPGFLGVQGKGKAPRWLTDRIGLHD